MKTKRYQIGSIGAVLITLILLCQFLGCKPKDSDKDGVIDEKDKCIYVKGSKPDGCPFPPKIGKINLYLETSASMGGYFHGNAEFKQIISDLAVKMDKEISPVSIHFISEKVVDYPGNATKFSSDIATTDIALAKGSELHHIFDTVAKATKDGDISIMVSDCILSFPNSAVKANPLINKESASGTLKNNIYSTFIELKHRGQAASLYAFSSAFYGSYYDYQNVKTLLSGTVRPFYVWVIAKNKLLPVFDGKLASIPNFKPEKELHFGLIDRKVNRYHIITQLWKQGSYELIRASKGESDVGIENVETKAKEALGFSAVLDLNALPPYAKNISYLQNKLKMELKGCTAEVQISETSPSLVLKNKNQMAYYEQASHVLKITVKNIRLPYATISLTLPLEYDSWSQEWSTMDDKGINKLGKKTFAFTHLVDGVKEAYNNSGKNFIDLKFQINQ